MKGFVKLLLFLTFVCIGQESFAQFMGTPPTTIWTPRGSVYIPGNMHYFYFFAYSPEFLNKKHKFYIVLLNDSTIDQRTRINLDEKTNRLNWKDRKKKENVSIEPNQTKEIYRYDVQGKKITGVPLDSCWIFLVDDKKIRTYSVTSDIEKPLISHIQKGESGAIMALTKENLEPIISSHPKALRLLEKKKLIKAIKAYNK